MEKRVSRTTVYERVWSVPVRTLAREYGVSDVGLAKICRRYQIPLPGPGYWSKRAHGKASAPPSLPPSNDDEEIIITGDQYPALPSVPGIPEVVPTTIHSSVAKTNKLLAAAPRSWKRLVQPTPGCLNVCVSIEGRPRAMRLMNALIATLEGAGATVEAAM